MKLGKKCPTPLSEQAEGNFKAAIIIVKTLFKEK